MGKLARPLAFVGIVGCLPPKLFGPKLIPIRPRPLGGHVCVSVQLVLGIYRGTAGYLHEVDPNVAGEKEANMLKTTSRKPPYPFGVLDDLDLDYPMILWVYGCLFQLTPKMRKMDFGFPFDKRVRFKTT